jgi:SAM-dependent methyltransferase
MGIRARVPWWGKLGAKIVLSRLPVSYRTWAKVGIFKHGAMIDPRYALDVFQFHYRSADVASMRTRPVVLELGPGDSLLSAPIAYAFGTERSYLLDTGSFATRELAPFSGLLELLARDGRDVRELRDCRDWDEILVRCRSEYLTQGLESLGRIPDTSIDFIWSQAVLEHVPRRDFPALMRELRRVLRGDGRCSHTVDLGDHLGGGLNNLRFSEAVWEGRLFSRSGFYTNRIRYGEMLSLFREAGFAVHGTTRKTWDRLPTARTKLNGQFVSLPDEDLLTLGFDVVLGRAP